MDFRGHNPKAPSGRELAPKATEGERVTIELVQIQSCAGSFRPRYAANPQSSFHSLRGTPAACHRIRLRMSLPEEGYVAARQYTKKV